MVIETGKPIAEVARDLGIVVVSQDDRSRPALATAEQLAGGIYSALGQTSPPGNQARPGAA